MQTEPLAGLNGICPTAASNQGCMGVAYRQLWLLQGLGDAPYIMRVRQEGQDSPTQPNSYLSLPLLAVAVSDIPLNPESLNPKPPGRVSTGHCWF